MSERIFYIDLFSKTNSNFYWLAAFEKLGVVQHFDIRNKEERLENIILDFKPTHIHLGGSVKHYRSVDPKLLSRIKKKLSCGISVFYGDAPYSEYHIELAKVVDCIYISNKTHIQINAKKGFSNFQYLPCPTEPRVFKYYPTQIKYDLLFIGANTGNDRRTLLEEIAKKFDLVVAGARWEGTELHYLPATYGKGFSVLCGQAKISLGIHRRAGLNLDSYFSNRLLNLLASRAFVIHVYSKGMEDLFENHKHFVWFKSEQELFAMIDYYLKHPKKRQEIAKQGQKEILTQHTFDHHVKKIIKECK